VHCRVGGALPCGHAHLRCARGWRHRRRRRRRRRRSDHQRLIEGAYMIAPFKHHYRLPLRLTHALAQPLVLSLTLALVLPLGLALVLAAHFSTSASQNALRCCCKTFAVRRVNIQVPWRPYSAAEHDCILCHLSAHRHRRLTLRDCRPIASATPRSPRIAFDCSVNVPTAATIFSLPVMCH
jgi:hypothetical protein